MKPRQSMRLAACGILRRCMESRLCEISQEELGCSAWVFAPHQDDEILGCGGTIHRKLAAGARVRIAFLTDGGGSHSHLIPAREVVEIRRREARAAALRLGVDGADVVFLDLPDGGLPERAETGAALVEDLLRRSPSDEVYLPYRYEPQPDHAAANALVRSGLARAVWDGWVYEYPVWFWDAWPWTRQSTGGVRSWPGQLARTLRMNLRLLRDFRAGVSLGPSLAAKRAALAEYGSQMSREGRAADWPILADVAGGSFLECLLQRHEIFHRYRREDSTGEADLASMRLR